VEVSRELIEYGYRVLLAWTQGGVLRDRAMVAGPSGGPVLGIQRVPRGLSLSADDAIEFVGEILILALRRFQTSGYEDWKPESGVSLKQHFLRFCLAAMPDAYLSWDRARRSYGLLLDDVPEPEDDVPSATDIAEVR
jgi:hypothetical protein